MNFFLFIPTAIIITLWLKALHQYSKHSSIRTYFWPALILKLLSGVLVGVLYQYYYQNGDTIAYWNDAAVLIEWAFENPDEYFLYWMNNDLPSMIHQNLIYTEYAPRAMFFAKITSIVYFLSNSVYWIGSLIFSLFSFTGLFLLSSYILKKHPHLTISVVFGCFFMPGFVFWSSGILKESIVIGSISLIIYYFLQFIDKEKPTLSKALFTIFFSFLLWKIKYYYAAVLLPLLVSALIAEKLSDILKNMATYRIHIWLVSLVLFGLFATLLNEALGLSILPEIIYSSYSEYINNSAPGSFIKYNQLDNTYLGIVKSLPLAFISSFSRPWLGESQNFFQFLSTVENLFILILFVFSIKNLVIYIKNKNVMIISALLFCVIAGCFVALSVPNFGSLIRFRTGWMFIFVPLILYNNPLTRVKKYLKK